MLSTKKDRGFFKASRFEKPPMAWIDINYFLPFFFAFFAAFFFATRSSLFYILDIDSLLIIKTAICYFLPFFFAFLVTFFFAMLPQQQAIFFAMNIISFIDVSVSYIQNQSLLLAFLFPFFNRAGAFTFAGAFLCHGHHLRQDLYISK